MEIHTAYYYSPVGIIEITGNEEGIATLYFLDEKKINSSEIHSSLQICIQQLDEYFHKKREKFELKLNPKGTVFQKSVWDKLLEIPFGKTTTYLDISRKIGDVNATRAVGNANGSNPISIIIPCHRVIGVDGKLVGYGGGLWRKQWLIEHENNIGKQTKLFSN